MNESAESVSEQDQILWHYTSVESAMSILTSGKLRLFDPTQGNDSMEGRYHDQMFEKELGLTPSAQDIFRAKMKKLDAKWQGFVACFSKLSDDAHQWRSYADNGSGVALGFSQQSFQTERFARDELWEVRYCTGEYDEGYLGDHARSEDEGIRGAWEDTYWSIRYSTKHPSFQTEQESRLLIGRRRADKTGLCQNDRLRFYIEHPLQPGSLVHVRLGPKCEVKELEFEHFVSAIGKHEHLGSEFAVSRSDSPLQ